METLAFEGTDGELTYHPTLEIVRELLDLDQDYWLGGSGSAMIGWVIERNPGFSINFNRPTLHIAVHEPYGVWILYREGNVERYVFDETAPEDLLVVRYMGGEPAVFPRAFFVSRPIAEQVIEEFLRSEGMSPAIAWRAPISRQYDGYACPKA